MMGTCAVTAGPPGFQRKIDKAKRLTSGTAEVRTRRILPEIREIKKDPGIG